MCFLKSYIYQAKKSRTPKNVHFIGANLYLFQFTKKNPRPTAANLEPSL